jgi:hypothetical protein
VLVERAHYGHAGDTGEAGPQPLRQVASRCWP